MGAQERIAAILRGGPAQRVNFSHDGVRVYGSGYARMAQLIDQGTLLIRLESNQARARAMYALGIGAYEHETNTFFVPSVNFPSASPFDAALVIHEMTHALLDWHRAPVNELLSETVAYLAQVMWLQANEPLAGGRLPAGAKQRIIGQVQGLAHDIFDAAWDAIADVYATPGGYEVPRGRKVDALKAAILAAPLYRGVDQQTVSFDGFATGAGPR